MADKTPGTWTAEPLNTHANVTGYRVFLDDGPAFLIYSDEIDGLARLLAGLKVDSAITELSEELADYATVHELYPDITEETT